MLPLILISLFTIIIVSAQDVKHSEGIFSKFIVKSDYQEFAGVFQHNSELRRCLLDEEVTLFVPTNSASKKFVKPIDDNIAFYHLAKGAWSLNRMGELQNMTTIRKGFPKLWISRSGDDIFVNNAKIISHESNYFGTTRGLEAKEQMLHVLDDVLDPFIRQPQCSNTALDIMTSPGKLQMAMFLHKVKHHELQHLFQVDGSNTYFIPIDIAIDPFKYGLINKHTIFGHIVPNYVLFSRPTMKRRNYETMANDDTVYMDISLEEFDNKLYVHGATLIGTDENPAGNITAEILIRDIPVDSGVVHIISNPLGIYTEAPKPFPYLPIIDKLATDPSLSIFYEMGETIGFNQLFNTRKAKFTYFVPNDISLRHMEKKGLTFTGSVGNLLKRHLIISDYVFSMERLHALTEQNNRTEIELKSVGGSLRIIVAYIEKHFYIKWDHTFIKVIRPNYQCTDGIVHILAGPIANLQ